MAQAPVRGLPTWEIIQGCSAKRHWPLGQVYKPGQYDGLDTRPNGLLDAAAAPSPGPRRASGRQPACFLHEGDPEPARRRHRQTVLDNTERRAITTWGGWTQMAARIEVEKVKACIPATTSA
jgi:hypothetical protein